MGENEIVAEEFWRNTEAEISRENTITPAMMRAGVAALAAWSYEDEEPENAIASIWYAMTEAKCNPTLPE